MKRGRDMTAPKHQKHAIHRTTEALKEEMSREIGLPVTASIDFMNVEYSARKANFYVEHAYNHDAAKVLRLISEMRDALDSAERAIKWGKPE